MESLDEIVGEFLVESHENLLQLDRDLVALEQQPQSRELISRIFRRLDTIRGASGFLAFSRLETLTHAGQSLLSRLRDGGQEVTADTVATVAVLIEAVRELLAAIERTGDEGDVDVREIILAVNRQLIDGPVDRPAAAPGGAHRAVVDPSPAVDTAGPPPPSPAPPGLSDGAPGLSDGAPGLSDGAPGLSDRAPGLSDRAPGLSGGAPSGTPVPLVESPRRELPEPTADQRRPLGEMLVETGATSSSDVASALARQLDGDERKLGTILLDEGKAAPTAVTEALQAQAPRRSAAEKTVRVDVELLDGLVGLVGELVLARNQLVRGVTDAGDPVLARTAQRLGAIAGELQDGIMKTRMQAIDHLFGELPRLVRDLSNSLDKQVRLVIQGQQTELDRTLLEAVRDPVAHLVRNAVQHGIEAPVERIAKGKDPEGVLTLRAFHEGANVTVEVADDGAGLDVEWIASGMDDVKSNIERIGGAVAVETVPGQGAVRRLTIPETLAVIQALTVDCGEQRYVLPKASVLELVFIDGQQTRIEYAEAAPVYRLRGMLLPLVRLDRVLGLQVGGDEGVYVVVLQAEGRRFGLVVDRILNTEEIVVKALHTRFKDVGLYAGATILADGKVGLILDPQTLARRSDLGSVGVPAATDPPTAEDRPGGGSTGAGSAQPLLVTAVGDRRVAIPLDPDTRLAEFPRDRIQRVGAREVVQYEGQVLPLMRLSNLLGAYQEESTGDGDTVSVVVYSDGERRVALVVDRIVDLAPDPQGTHRDEGATGAGRHAASRQRAAELLDVRKAILAADPNIYNEQPDLVAAAVATRAELSE